MPALFLFFFLVFVPILCADDLFRDQIEPFTKKHCNRCHNEEKARGDLDLTKFSNAEDVVKSFRRWSHVIEFVQDGEMPPEDEDQPSIEEREAVLAAVSSILLVEARKNAGDPGVVLPRRLSNTEFDLSVRDLTGVDIRPTREFPADPAGGEGFDNTGEVLAMSPGFLSKLLGASEHVADHLVLTPDGISFAPFPVTSYADRKKLTEQAIIDFYEAHDVTLLDYLEAVWRRETPDGLSSKYLAELRSTLDEASEFQGHLKEIGALWDSIPAPTESGERPQQLLELERRIQFAKRQLHGSDESLIRASAGNWVIAQLALRADKAAKRDQFDPGSLKSSYVVRHSNLKPKDGEAPLTIRIEIEPAFEDSEKSTVIVRSPVITKRGDPPRNEKESTEGKSVLLREFLEEHAPGQAAKLEFGEKSGDPNSFRIVAPSQIELVFSPEGLEAIDGRNLLLPCELESGSANVVYGGKDSAELLMNPDSELAQRLSESNKRFCQTFPNKFVYVDGQRGLAAGFHLVEGVFRDDQPLVEKVLDEPLKEDLDRLWEKLHFVTRSAEKMLRGFVWFERAERHKLHGEQYDFLRSEDPRLVEAELLKRFETVYLENMGESDHEMIRAFFDETRKALARRLNLEKAAEQRGLADLSELAERAWGRALTNPDSAGLNQIYQTLRAQDLDVEEALRGVFTSILMSPDFSFRYAETAGQETQQLPSSALAKRLSYFLWSSLPDDELLAADLQDPAVLIAQTRRMLLSPKVEAFAREFPSQWLRFRDYLDKDSINAAAFKVYTQELREAMFEEPARLAAYLIREDLPVTDLLDSDSTFVNSELASHYQMEGAPEAGVWKKVDGLREHGRGGLFGMAVILTKNSAGERTSPVKRGFWTVHHLLGQHFPPPPADVPELPTGEKDAPETIRELMAKHAADSKCAMCHKHFDGIGLALEGFDPIGRSRTIDLAGRKIDNVAQLPNGDTAEGLSGLIDYVSNHRRDDFIQTLCRKFLGYALGRSVILSDQPLLERMEAELAGNEYRFSALFETVVTSSQFRQQRADN